MMFDRYEVDSRSPDQIENDIVINHEFPQIIASPKLFLNTVWKPPRLGKGIIAAARKANES
jgi:hypothetical protein